MQHRTVTANCRLCRPPPELPKSGPNEILGVMMEVALRPLESVPASELAALSSEVFGDEQPSEHLAEVLAAEAAARPIQAQEAQQHTFGLAAYRSGRLIGWTQGSASGQTSSTCSTPESP